MKPLKQLEVFLEVVGSRRRQPALHDTPQSLDLVCMDTLTAHILLTVIHLFMFVPKVMKFSVATETIRVDHGFCFTKAWMIGHNAALVLLNLPSLSLGHNQSTHLPVSLSTIPNTHAFLLTLPSPLPYFSFPNIDSSISTIDPFLPICFTFSSQSLQHKCLK